MNIRRKIQAFMCIVVGEIKRVLFGIKYYAEADITDNCNLRCRHCYHFKKNLAQTELPLDVWEKRFEDIYKKGIRFIMLVGGEPTLRLDIIELAHKTFPFVSVFTNGQIKIPEKFNRLLLFLSLDGDREKNDAIRGNGTFEKLFKNYSKDKRAIINITLLGNNYTELEKVVRLAKQHSLRGVSCNLYTSTNTSHSDPSFINEKERNAIITELRRVKKLYPWDFLLTESMIDWYAKANHSGYCFWGDEALHFDSSWKNRRCFFIKTDCAHCGCFAGAAQNPLSFWHHVREAFMLV